MKPITIRSDVSPSIGPTTRSMIHENRNNHLHSPRNIYTPTLCKTHMPPPINISHVSIHSDTSELTPHNFNTQPPPNNFNTQPPPNNFNTQPPPNNFNTQPPPNNHPNTQPPITTHDTQQLQNTGHTIGTPTFGLTTHTHTHTNTPEQQPTHPTNNTYIHINNYTLNGIHTNKTINRSPLSQVIFPLHTQYIWNLEHNPPSPNPTTIPINTHTSIKNNDTHTQTESIKNNDTHTQTEFMNTSNAHTNTDIIHMNDTHTQIYTEQDPINN
eukprot:GHVR01018246.1.p1 GENE.GHVR01018246.1~~GHVR01018246.1.p1  ORF type:complete len:269 (-),score=74.65 GHVR01018246.1:223-1029(-)